MRFRFLVFSVLYTQLFLFTSCERSTSSEQTNTQADITVVPTLSFAISTNKDTTIIGRMGTRLFIGKESFQFEDSTLVKDSVKIEMKEYYQMRDILLADLTTQADTGMLETGGMLNIKASSNGKPLQIRKGKALIVRFPKTSNDLRPMSLFYADAASTDTSVNRWKLDDVPSKKDVLYVDHCRYAHWGDNSYTMLNPQLFTDTIKNKWNFELKKYINAFDFSKSTMDEVEENEEVTIKFDLGSNGKVKNPVIQENLSKETEKEILKFMFGVPAYFPEKDGIHENTNKKSYFVLTKKSPVPYYSLNEDFVNSLKNKKTKMNELSRAELNYYIFQVTKLGWINCDRFLNCPNPVNFIVDIPMEPGLSLKMVFTDIKGVMKPEKLDGKFVFARVCKDNQVTIMAIKKDKGKLYTAFTDVVLSEKPLTKIDLKETTLEELNKELDRLNK